MSIPRVIRDGMRQGFAEGIAELRSRLFIVGMLLGTGATTGALLAADAINQPFVDRAIGVCIACSVTGVVLFSRPAKEKP